MSEADPPGEWRYALPLDDLWDGEVVAVRVGAREVMLANLRGDVHAYDNRCPHAGARLSEGMIRGVTLRCAAHHWEFDVLTGAGVNPRTCALQRYPVRIVDGAVMVHVPW